MTNGSVSTTLAQLVARSRRLGADRTVCNWGGGNTSAKADEVDFRGRPARMLWVKGSGSDLATVTEASFTGLFMDDILPLLERERMSDAEMVANLAHYFSEPGRPRPSIETLLHGFLPFTHIDHTHADATNYFACAEGGESLARDCFGEVLIWIPYRRPGFGLAREVALALRVKPDAKLVILASAEELATYLNKQYGAGRAVIVKMDVTSEESVRAAFVRGALAFGGVDVFVNNAGLASSASITETTLSEWNKNWHVLATGYFLVAREAFRLLQAQGRGGNLVFVASKNALVAGKNAAAYSTAKAAEAHLARCLAEEGAPCTPPTTR